MFKFRAPVHEMLDLKDITDFVIQHLKTFLQNSAEAPPQLYQESSSSSGLMSAVSYSRGPP